MIRATVLLVLTTCVMASAQATYAPGTVGAGGFMPSLSCGQAYMGNGGFSFNVSNGLGGSLAWVGVSMAAGSTVWNGTSIWLDLNPVNNFLRAPVPLSGPAGVAGAGQGALNFPLTIPVIPSLAGNTVYAQALIDEGGGFAATNAIEVRLTMPPRLLVATFVLGNPDPVYVVDPITQTLEHQFNGAGPGAIPAGVGDVTDAEFGFDGTRAYFSQAVGITATAAGTLGVHELDMTVSPPTWTILYSGSGSAYGVGVDDVRARVYTVMGPTSSTRELVAVDCRVGSPTYGVAVASTVGLGSPSRWIDRWELSPDGTRAAMVTASSRELLIVDTDPSSPGYMDWNVVGVVPTGSAIATHVTDVDFSPDGQRLIFSINLIGFGSIPGEVARYDLSSASWIDHNGAMPGVQNIGPDSIPPAAVPDSADGIEYAPDGTFAAVSGWGPRSGLGRVDLDPANALSWSYSSFASPVDLSGDSYRCAVSPDSAQLATYGSRQLVIFNRDGSHSGTVALPGSGNVYTITWHE